MVQRVVYLAAGFAVVLLAGLLWLLASSGKERDGEGGVVVIGAAVPTTAPDRVAPEARGTVEPSRSDPASPIGQWRGSGGWMRIDRSNDAASEAYHVSLRECATCALKSYSARVEGAAFVVDHGGWSVALTRQAVEGSAGEGGSLSDCLVAETGESFCRSQ